MPKFEFVAKEEELLVSARRSLNLPPSSATRRIERKTPSKYRNLLGPSIQLGDATGDGKNLILQADSLNSFSFSSLIHNSENECDLWVTKVEYHPGDKSKMVGCKGSTTAVITASSDGKQRRVIEVHAKEGVENIVKEDKKVQEAELLAAHLYFDQRLKGGELVASATFSSPSQHWYSIDFGAMLRHLLVSLFQCGGTEDCNDDDSKEMGRNNGEDGTVVTLFTEDGETLTTNYDASTYTSTYGDGGTATIETRTTRYDDDTLTFNDTLTYNDTLTHRGFDESTMCEDDTLGTYNDGTTLEDETSVMEEEEIGDDIEGSAQSVRNQDSSYGSPRSFRSPLSDSYRSPNKTRPSVEESQSHLLRSSPQFRISLLPPDISTRNMRRGAVEEMDSLSYSKSRSMNRNFINSFIELKSTSTSSHNLREQQSENQQDPTNDVDSPIVFFTIDDVEELEQYEAEKRDESQKDMRDQPQPIWRNFDESPPPPAQSEQKATKSNDLSSRSVRITITKTQKKSNSEEEGECTKSSSYYTPPNSCHSRQDGNSPNEVREEPESERRDDNTETCMPSNRSAESVFRIEEDSATIDVSQSPAKKFAAPTIDANAEEDPLTIVQLQENVSPIARLRNPMSYDVLASN